MPEDLSGKRPMYQAENARRKRARDVLTWSGYKVGGHLGRHDDKAVDAKMIESGIHQREHHERGGKLTKLHFRDGGAAQGEGAPARLDRRGRKGGRARRQAGGTAEEAPWFERREAGELYDRPGGFPAACPACRRAPPGRPRRRSRRGASSPPPSPAGCKTSRSPHWPARPGRTA
jgi:hypothetical protein